MSETTPGTTTPTFLGVPLPGWSAQIPASIFDAATAASKYLSNNPAVAAGIESGGRVLAGQMLFTSIALETAIGYKEGGAVGAFLGAECGAFTGAAAWAGAVAGRTCPGVRR